MPQIKVNTSRISSLATSLRNVKIKADSGITTVAAVRQNLNLKIAATEEIEARLWAIQKRMQKQEDLLDQYITFLQATNDAFMKTDKDISKQAREVNYLAAGIAATLAMPPRSVMGLGQIIEQNKVDQLSALFNTATKFPIGQLPINMMGLYQIFDQINGQDESKKKEGAMWSAGFGDEQQDFNFSFLKQASDKGKFEGSLLNFDVTSKDEIFGMGVATTVVSSILAVRGSGKVSFDVFATEKEAATKKGLDYDSKNANNMMDGFTDYNRTQVSKTETAILNIGVAAEVGATVATLNYKSEVGNEAVNGTVDANLKFLDADAGVTYGARLDEYGLSVKVKGEMGASVAEIEASTALNIGGIEAKTTVSAEVGIGIYGELGYSQGKITVGFGGSMGIGGKVKFEIKVPDLGLPWW